MRKNILIIIFLLFGGSISVFCQHVDEIDTAQSTIEVWIAQKKHEIQIGSTGAYFFDGQPFEWQNFNFPLPTHIAYYQTLKNTNQLGVSFQYITLFYRTDEPYFYPGQLIDRSFMTLNINYSKRVKNIFPYVGLSYRFYSQDFVFIQYTSPFEGFFDTYDFNGLGLQIGFRRNLLKIKNYRLGFDINYTRYWSERNKNQVATVGYVSYMF